MAVPRAAAALLAACLLCPTQAHAAEGPGRGYNALLPSPHGNARAYLQLECGVFDLAPILTTHAHLGALVLPSEVGPVDVTCRRARQSAWLLDTCASLRPQLEAKAQDLELLTSLCRRGTRKIKRAFFTGCTGMTSVPAADLSRLSHSPRSVREMKLFCTFTADCTLDDYLQGCREGFGPVLRLFDFCRDSAALEALQRGCRQAHPEGVPDPMALLAGLAGPNVTAAPAGKQQGNSSATAASAYAANLSDAIAEARDLAPRLRPFVKYPAGLLAGRVTGGDSVPGSGPGPRRAPGSRGSPPGKRKGGSGGTRQARGTLM